MVNGLLRIQYNIAKANVTDKKVQNIASCLTVKILKAIHKIMKSGSYRQNPTKMKPLGIFCYVDKLVENAIAQILEQIYEPKFYNESFRFRPNRNSHM